MVVYTIRTNPQIQTLRIQPRTHPSILHQSSLFHLRNLIASHKNGILLQTRLHRVLLREDRSQLFQGALARLHKQEVDNEHFESVPEDEQEVVFPAGAGERNARHEGVVEGGDVDEEL